MKEKHILAEVTEHKSCIQIKNFPKIKCVSSPSRQAFVAELVFKWCCPLLLLPGVRLRTCRVSSTLHSHPPALRPSAVLTLWTRPCCPPSRDTNLRASQLLKARLHKPPKLCHNDGSVIANTFHKRKKQARMYKSAQSNLRW